MTKKYIIYTWILLIQSICFASNEVKYYEFPLSETCYQFLESDLTHYPHLQRSALENNDKFFPNYKNISQQYDDTSFSNEDEDSYLSNDFLPKIIGIIESSFKTLDNEDFIISNYGTCVGPFHVFTSGDAIYARHYTFQNTSKKTLILHPWATKVTFKPLNDQHESNSTRYQGIILLTVKDWIKPFSV